MLTKGRDEYGMPNYVIFPSAMKTMNKLKELTCVVTAGLSTHSPFFFYG